MTNLNTEWNEAKPERIGDKPKLDLGEPTESFRDEFFNDVESALSITVGPSWEMSEDVLNALEKTIDYKFNEPAAIEEIKNYIDSTYSNHYARKNKFQIVEGIMAKPERGVGFCVGNILKYTDRFGEKKGFNRLDILKTIHYSILLLSIDLSDIESE